MGRGWLPRTKAGIESTLSSPPDGRKGMETVRVPWTQKKRICSTAVLRDREVTVAWPSVWARGPGPEMHPVTSGNCEEPQCPTSTETLRSLLK